MKQLLGMLVIVAGLFMPLFAQTSEVYITAKGAIQGYDPVAYFYGRQTGEGKKGFCLFLERGGLVLFKFGKPGYFPGQSG